MRRISEVETVKNMVEIGQDSFGVLHEFKMHHPIPTKPSLQDHCGLL